jgi:DNA replication protein DnaC
MMPCTFPQTQEMKMTENPSQLKSCLESLSLKYFYSSLEGAAKELSPQVREAALGLILKSGRHELSERLSHRIESRIRSAQFERVQTIDDFDFDYNPSTRGLKKRYLTLFNELSNDNLPSAVFTGNAGLGKTHLARALGYKACQQDISVRFTSTSQMVNRLTSAQRDHDLERELNKYRRPQLLILDELGYITMDNQASNLFFQVISKRHDMGLGTIATTNIAFGKWNRIFASDAIAHVIVNRLASEAEAFFIEGDSYRPKLKGKKKISRK